MKKSCLFGALSTCAISMIFSTNVNALIIDSGTYLTDTTTSLEWLDMSYTHTLSFNDVLAATSGGSLDSWSIASEAQVLELVSNYLGHSPACCGWSSVNKGVLGLANLFGPTFIQQYDNGYEARYVIGFTSDGGNQFTQFGDYAYNDATELYTVGQAASSQDDSFGTFLVREIPTSVPIPASAWLFGSGLLGLIGIARRKKAA